MKNEMVTSANCLENVQNVAVEKKRFTLVGVEFVYIYLIGIGFAMLGWIVENVYRIAAKGIVDCRFHLLPFIWSYSLIPFAYQLLLGDPDRIAFFGHRVFKKDTVKTKIFSNILCLVLISAAVFLGELVVGNAWEALFGVRLWNYSSQPLHVTQYAGVVSTVGFGVGAYLIFRFAYKPLLSFVRNKVNYNVAKVICLSLGVLIVLDSLVMTIQIAVLHRAPMYWSVQLW